MTHKRSQRIERLRAVEREFLIVSDSLERLRISFADGRVTLPDGTSPRDLDAARTKLEPNFLIRLWAEFETAALSYYLTVG